MQYQTKRAFHVCIIPKGEVSSTFHGRYDADTAVEACTRYINADWDRSSGAQVAQTKGGTVIVTPYYSRDYGLGELQCVVQCVGHQIFEVEPVAEPKARIVRQIGV